MRKKMKILFWFVACSLITGSYIYAMSIPIVVVPMAIIYFLPSIIGIIRKNPALPPVILFNFACGWMIFPWFVLMYMVIFEQEKARNFNV